MTIMVMHNAYRALVGMLQGEKEEEEEEEEEPAEGRSTAGGGGRGSRQRKVVTAVVQGYDEEAYEKIPPEAQALLSFQVCF